MMIPKKKLMATALLAVLYSSIVLVLYFAQIIKFNQHSNDWFALLPYIFLLGIGLLFSSKIGGYLTKEKGSNLKFPKKSKRSIKDTVENTNQKEVNDISDVSQPILTSSTETVKLSPLDFKEQQRIRIISEEIDNNKHLLQKSKKSFNDLIEKKIEEINNLLDKETKEFSIHPNLKSLMQDLQELQKHHVSSLESFCKDYAHYTESKLSCLLASDEFDKDAFQTYEQQSDLYCQKWSNVKSIVSKMNGKRAAVINEIGDLKRQQCISDAFISQCNEVLDISLIREYHTRVTVHLGKLIDYSKELTAIVDVVAIKLEAKKNYATVSSIPYCQVSQLSK